MTKKPNWTVQVYNADFSTEDKLLDLEYLAGDGFTNYLRALHDLRAPIWKEIKSTIQSFQPNVIGITTKSQNFASACIVSRIAKDISPQVTVIAGGPHASLAGGNVLGESTLDIVVMREGENTLVELLDALESGSPLSLIDGIAFREGDTIKVTSPREFMIDLDWLPFPVEIAPQVLVNYENYPMRAFKFMFAVRGCPFNCTFCGSRNIWTRKTRYRSIENIIAEIKAIRKAGVNYIHFDDDTFGVTRDFIHDLCTAMQKYCSGLNWSCEMHVKLVDEKTISIMKSSGCRSIIIGVESGNNAMLKMIRKNIKIEDAFDAARIIKKFHIYLQTFFIVGFPHETEKSLNDTITAMLRIPADFVIFSIFTPYLGTDLFEYCLQQGVIENDFDPSLYNHQSPENYFCPKIPRELFQEQIRKIEKKLDRLNSRRKIHMYFSCEGLRKMHERGLRVGISRFIQLLRKI